MAWARRRWLCGVCGRIKGGGGGASAPHLKSKMAGRTRRDRPFCREFSTLSIIYPASAVGHGHNDMSSCLTKLSVGRHVCPRACVSASRAGDWRRATSPPTSPAAAAWWRQISGGSRQFSGGGGECADLIAQGRGVAARASGGDAAPPAAAAVDTDALLASYLSEHEMGQVRAFAGTLLEWNKHMNLTGAATVVGPSKMLATPSPPRPSTQ